ncbi:MAG TPA: hypothetical protein VE153_00695 [Myxococcus sp.]|nr:hypothetical protein [Myxococcus sp.]
MKSHKVKTLKELFVQDLARLRGGESTASTSSTETQSTTTATHSTTQACCEEGANDPCC